MRRGDDPTTDAQLIRRALDGEVRALDRLLDRHQDQLTVAPVQAAVLLRGLLFANAHQLLHGDEHMTPAQLVDVLLNGITETA